MNRKPPIPVCKAFLVCRQLQENEHGEDLSLLGLARAYWTPNYPSSFPLSFFARLTSAHGSYRAEVQLQTLDGEVLWSDGPLEAWPLNDPLEMYDLKLNLIVQFPTPGLYDFVLLANDEEVARQRFQAKLKRQKAEA